MISRYSRDEMADIWSESSKYSSWAHVERAHLETLAELNICSSQVLADFDRALKAKGENDYLQREQETGHDVIAFIAEVGEEMGPASGLFLHRGLTSSDVLDTSLSLRILKSLQILDRQIRAWKEALAEKCFAHAQTLCIGRTHGIHAEPMAFGQVLASYFAEASRAHQKLLRAMQTCARGKLSGAVGVYSQLSPLFEARVLRKLGLQPEVVASQVIPRDRILEAARAAEDLAACMERFALNLRHFARTELGEVLEPFGSKQKGSSAMPHKKNPILSENLSGLARVVHGAAQTLSQNGALWHERDISHSSVERMALPDLFVVCDFMLARITKLTRDMDISEKAMLRNLQLTGGLWASGTVLTRLVEKGMPRTTAYELVQSVALPLAREVREARVEANAFQKALAQDPHVNELLSSSELEEIFQTNRYLEHVPTVFARTFGTTPDALDGLGQGEETFQSARIPVLDRIYEVSVQLQPDVLDTEAKTIHADLRGKLAGVSDVRQKRVFQIRIPFGQEEADLEDKIQTYAATVLHNGVMEEYKVEVVQ